MMKSKTSEIAALILLLVVFGFLATERLIVGDEGFYSGAAKSWIEGKTIYHDFFFPQTPLTVWAYGLWIKIFGATWTSARALSALLSCLIGILLFTTLKKFGAKTAWIGLLLFVSHTFVFAWYPTVKPYALSVLLLMGSLFLAESLKSPSRTMSNQWRLILAGFLFGLSTLGRLYFAGLAPVMLYLVSRDSKPGEKNRNFALFIFGGLISILPMVSLALRDFDTFWFNNLGYHFIRDNIDGHGSMRHRLVVLSGLLGIRDPIQVDGFQFPLLLLLTVVGQAYLWSKERRVSGAFLVGAGLFVLNLLPTPTYYQYFCTLIPFMILSSAPLIKDMKFIYLFIFIIPYSSFIPDSIQRIMVTGEYGSGVGPLDTQNSKVKVLDELASEINKRVPNGEVVVADWPGLIFSSHASYYPGLENHFGKTVATLLSPELRRKYKIMSIGEIRQLRNSPSVNYLLMSDKERKVFTRDIQDNLENFEALFNIRGIILAKRIQAAKSE